MQWEGTLHWRHTFSLQVHIMYNELHTVKQKNFHKFHDSFLYLNQDHFLLRQTMCMSYRFVSVWAIVSSVELVYTLQIYNLTTHFSLPSLSLSLLSPPSPLSPLSPPSATDVDWETVPEQVPPKLMPYLPSSVKGEEGLRSDYVSTHTLSLSLLLSQYQMREFLNIPQPSCLVGVVVSLFCCEKPPFFMLKIHTWLCVVFWAPGSFLVVNL